MSLLSLLSYVTRHPLNNGGRARALARRKAFAGDNGRVLGYDNAHGRRHRHFLGVETDVPSMRYEDLLRLFNRQWRMLALQFVNGEELKLDS